MTEPEKAAEKTPTPEKTAASKDADTGADAGQAEMQAAMDDVTEKGYFGQKVDPVPDLEYSILTGPDSPPNVPDDRTRCGMPETAKE